LQKNYKQNILIVKQQKGELIMRKAKPKTSKLCVFCEYWAGECHLKFISEGAWYEFDDNVRGKCMKNGATTHAGHIACNKYEPNREAKKLL
jgi:hypothetical protein